MFWRWHTQGDTNAHSHLSSFFAQSSIVFQTNTPKPRQSPENAKSNMKFTACILASLAATSSAFTVPRHALTQKATSKTTTAQTRAAPTLTRFAAQLEEFDYLLQESNTVEIPSTPSRRRIALSNNEHRSTVLASSFAGPTTADMVEQLEETEAADPYADQLQKITQFQEQAPPTMADKFKQMDLQDIIITLFVPSVALFAAGRWGFNKVAGRVQESCDEQLESFAREMLYHDGDFKEMELCVADYSKKLMFLGPAKKDTMLKRYLEAYAKKKTINPQAIASLSYAFTIFKLSEAKAAALLVSLCKQMGTDKISSAGKLLFLGSRILKSKEGKEALTPIKDLIKSTYRDAEVAEMLVETSQHAIAEASYRATIQAAGKNQKSLTVGWEVLGLDREIAERIFEEEAKDGFLSDREAMYGGQAQKYDKKGHRVNADGTLEDPEEAAKAEEEDNEPISNVYECGECGYTMFIAKGRESKFFGEGFTCPECGAPKDKFKARDDLDE